MNWFVAHSPRHVFRRLQLLKMNSLTKNLRSTVKTIFKHAHESTAVEPMGNLIFNCSAIDVGPGYWLQIHVVWKKCTIGLLHLNVLVDVVPIGRCCGMHTAYTVH